VTKPIIAVLPTALALAGAALAADAPKKVGYDDTPMQPNGKWHVHDGKRPQPRVVTPGTFSTPEKPGQAPSDAVVLLGKDLSQWQMVDGGGPVTWKLGKDGVLETGKGFIQTKQKWKDFQLHVEWATPSVVKGDGQGRGNSGVFMLGKYEVQVLDSYNNPTYPDGQASAMYGQYPPLVNASRKPGEWQVYDIVFTAARFDAAGKVQRPAVITVFHNGVVTHNANAYLGPTSHRKIGDYAPDQAEGPIVLQDHGNPIRYRNIWIRPLKGYDEP
jgi:hypothetical protein